MDGYVYSVARRGTNQMTLQVVKIEDGEIIAPVDEANIRIWYSRKPLAVTSVTDACEIPDELTDALLNGILSKVHEIKGNDQRSILFHQKFEKYLKEGKDKLASGDRTVHTLMNYKF